MYEVRQEVPAQAGTALHTARVSRVRRGDGAGMMIYEIPITAKQQDMAAWAVDAMIDMQESNLRDDPDEAFDEKAFEELDVSATHLVLPDDEEITEDLLYRLEEQVQDMSKSYWDEGGRSDSQVAMRLADKIRKITRR